MPALTMAVHFLVLARHEPGDTSPVAVLVAVLITLVLGARALLRKHDVGTREPQPHADLKRPMLTAAELRRIDFTSLPMSPASSTNEELRKLRVKGGARRWQFLVRGYSHTTTCGPVARYMLYNLLREGDGLRLIRSPHNPYDANAIHVVPEAGELAGVDLGFVPREFASELAPLLDAGAEFYAEVQRVAIDDQINGFPKLYVYLRMVSSEPVKVSVPNVVRTRQAGTTAAITGGRLVRRKGILTDAQVAEIRRIGAVEPGESPSEVSRHAEAVATEPVTVKPAEEAVPGFAIPQRQAQEKTGRVQLDPALMEAKLKETAAVSALLASVFAEEPLPAAASRATADGCIPGLDEDTSAFVRHLATREVWSRGELERFASARALLLDGTLDAINEAALEACGALALEGDDPVEVDVVVMTALVERIVAL
jgi:hypothetical protein